MTTELKEDALILRLSATLTAVASSIDPHPSDTSPRPVEMAPRRRGRRSALVAAVVLAFGAPIGAVAWIGASPDWTKAPEPPRAIEILRIGEAEIWLAYGEGPNEDVKVLSEDSSGDEWSAFSMQRHADAPLVDLGWGTLLLEEEHQLVFYTDADKTVDTLRVVVDGDARRVTSHRVGNGSYAIFAVDPSADRLVVTPVRAGTALKQARLSMDIPAP
jgi:hypothetical protein